MNKYTRSKVELVGRSLVMPKQPSAHFDVVYDHCLKMVEASRTPRALESEWELAKRFDVSRRVSRRALQRLVREGRAICRRGSGYTTRPTPQKSDMKRLRVGIVFHPRPRAYAGVWSSTLAQLCDAFDAHKIASKAIPIQTPDSGLITQRALNEYGADAYLLCSLSPAAQAFFANQRVPTVVLGNTTRDLGLASVSLDELDIARQLSEKLLAAGHHLVALVQEKSLNLGAERSRIGFLYAHHAQLVRYHPDRLVRVDREKAGMSKELLRLFRMAPSALIVESVPLLEMIWSRVSQAQREWLQKTEVIVLSRDFTGELRHPAKYVDYDSHWEVEASVRLLEDCIRGRKSSERHLRIPWKLSEFRADGV